MDNETHNAKVVILSRMIYYPKEFKITKEEVDIGEVKLDFAKEKFLSTLDDILDNIINEHGKCISVIPKYVHTPIDDEDINKFNVEKIPEYCYSLIIFKEDKNRKSPVVFGKIYQYFIYLNIDDNNNDCCEYLQKRLLLYYFVNEGINLAYNK